MVRIPSESDQIEAITAIYKYERAVTQTLQHPNLMIPIDLREMDDLPLLIYDYQHDMSLSYLINKSQRIELPVFFLYIYQLMEAIQALHEKGFIHKSVHPSHIFINSFSRRLRLGGMGLLSPLPIERLHPTTFDTPYCESQTHGRQFFGHETYRIDSRYDIYQLGLVMFELLTGLSPFPDIQVTDTDSSVLVEPLTITALRPECPDLLSDIIDRCLQPTPDSRFLTISEVAQALRDLESQFKEGASNSLPKVVSPSDTCIYNWAYPSIFSQSNMDMILSRIRQIHLISCPMIILRGPGGRGKIWGVGQLLERIGKGYNKLYFRFDSDIQFSPFSAILFGLDSFLGSITEDSSFFHILTEAFQMSDSGPLYSLLELIPNLSRFIQSSFPSFSRSGEGNYQFINILCKLIKILAHENKPLILVLEQLHLADSASLQFIDYLLNNPDFKHVMLLSTYADTVEPRDQRAQYVSNWVAQHQSVTVIDLEKMQEIEYYDWVSRLLNQSGPLIQQMAHHLFRTFRENLFGAYIWLNACIQDFRKDHPSNQIELDLNAFTQQVFTRMTGTQGFGVLVTVDSEVRELLTLAAQIGTCFRLKTLHQISNKPLGKLVALLLTATRYRLIEPLDTTYKYGEFCLNIFGSLNYRFTHPSVYEDFKSIMSNTQSSRTRIQIGKLLWKNIKTNVFDFSVFSVAQLLKTAGFSGDEDIEKVDIVWINHQAGKKSKSFQSFDLAMRYFAEGGRHLTPDCWTHQYSLAYDLSKELLDCEYICGSFAFAEKRFALLLSKARSRLEYAIIHIIRIKGYLRNNQSEEGMALALSVMGEHFNIHINKSISRPHIWISAATVFWSLSNQTNDQILARELTDPEKQCLLTLYNFLAWTFVDWNSVSPEQNGLHYLSAFRVIHVSLQDGISAESALGFVLYSLYLAKEKKVISAAQKYATLALKVCEKFYHTPYRSLTQLIFGAYILPFTYDFERGLQMLGQAIEGANMNRDVPTLSRAIFAKLHLQQVYEDSISKIQKSIRIYNRMIGSRKEPLSVLELLNMMFISLSGNSKNLSDISNARISESQIISMLDHSYDQVLRATYCLVKVRLTYLCNQYSQAYQTGRKFEKDLEVLRGLPEYSEYCFYWALVLACIFPSRQPSERRVLIRSLMRYRQLFFKWSRQNPSGFMARYFLICGEICRIQRNDHDASLYFQQAVDYAQDHQHFFLSGLANELYARLMLMQNKKEKTAERLNIALQYYDRWGAKGKSEWIRNRYADILYPSQTRFSGVKPFFSSEGAVDIVHSLVDFKQLLQAIQAIAAQSDLSSLLETTTNLVLETTQADKMVLILAQKDEWRLACVGQLSNKSIEICDVPLAHKQDELPAWVQECSFTEMEPQVIVDALEDKLIARDSYVRDRGSRAMVLFPLIYNDCIMGYLYLESYRYANLFDAERLQVLEWLTAQVRVMIMNAQVLTEVKAKNEQLKLLQIQSRERRSHLHEQTKCFQILTSYKHKLSSVVGHSVSMLSKSLGKGIEELEQDTQYASSAIQLQDLNGQLDNLHDHLEFRRLEADLFQKLETKPRSEIEEMIWSTLSKAGAQVQLNRTEVKQNGVLRVNAALIQYVLDQYLMPCLTHDDTSEFKCDVKFPSSHVQISIQGSEISDSQRDAFAVASHCFICQALFKTSSLEKKILWQSFRQLRLGRLQYFC